MPKGRTKREEILIAAAIPRLPTLLAQGLTHEQIATQVGMSNSWVQRTASHLGLQTARTGPRPGASHPQWKGGRALEKHGYVTLWMPLHPDANSQGRCWEHRVVWEVEHARFLREGEVVHHEDEHPRHNWPSNLEMFATNGEHLAHEFAGLSTPNPKGGARPSQRWQIPGAYGSTETLSRCPDESETLAQCSLEIREKLAYYMTSFRPTTAHLSMSRRSILGIGAHRDPFATPSRA